MHHIALGIDPTPLGAGTVRAGHRRARRRPGARPRSRPAQRPLVRSPVHRRPRRCRHGGGDPGRGTPPQRRGAVAGRRGHQRRDRARQRGRVVGRVEPDRPGVRGRPDQLRSAGDGGRHRARPHRPGDVRAAPSGDRLPGLVRRARLRRAGHRRLRLGDHRRHRRDVPGRDHRCRRRHPRRPGGAHTARACPMDGRSPTCSTSTTTAGAWRSPRTTSGRSSWPRPRCGRASICSSSTPATRRSPTCASPGPSAPTSTRCARWCSAWCPTARSTPCARSATLPAPALSAPSSPAPSVRRWRRRPGR